LGHKQWKGYKLKERKESGTDGWTTIKRAKADVERMSGAAGKKSDEGRETGKQKRGGNERGARDRTTSDSTSSFIDCIVMHHKMKLCSDSLWMCQGKMSREQSTFLFLSFLSAGTVSVIVVDTRCFIKRM
jgi:hypothetical protein